MGNSGKTEDGQTDRGGLGLSGDIESLGVGAGEWSSPWECKTGGG